MGRSSTLKSIESFERLIVEHTDKIAQAIKTQRGTENIPHWLNEIKNFYDQREKLLKRL